MAAKIQLTYTLSPVITKLIIQLCGVWFIWKSAECHPTLVVTRLHQSAGNKKLSLHGLYCVCVCVCVCVCCIVYVSVHCLCACVCMLTVFSSDVAKELVSIHFIHTLNYLLVFSLILHILCSILHASQNTAPSGSSLSNLHIHHVRHSSNTSCTSLCLPYLFFLLLLLLICYLPIFKALS